jgi:uncharacterized membrane protein YkoI
METTTRGHTMHKRLAVIGIVAAVTSGAGAAAAASAAHHTDPQAERNEEARFTAAREHTVEVTRARAERAALGRHAGSSFDTHLQDEGGLTWEVKVDGGGHVWEVNIDAHTGKIVSDQGDE